MNVVVFYQNFTYRHWNFEFHVVFNCHCIGENLDFPSGAGSKEPACQCRRCKKHGFDPWVGKISWRRATHSSILAWRIPMDREAWEATVHRVAKSWTLLKRLSTHACKRKLSPPSSCLSPLLSHYYTVPVLLTPCACVFFPTPSNFVGHQLGVLQFNSILTLSIWRYHQIHRLKAESTRLPTPSDAGHISRWSLVLLIDWIRQKFQWPPFWFGFIC